MKTYWVVPRDPLLVRDGRPFNNRPGDRAASLPFPLPATIAGAVGGMLRRGKHGRFVIRGPLLAERPGDSARLLLPAPADALLIDVKGESGQAQRYALAPIEKDAGLQTDAGLEWGLVAPAEVVEDKPASKAPHFWYVEEMLKWLGQPSSKKPDRVSFDNLGLPALVTETRVHVGIDSTTNQAVPGMLFTTSGLEFMHVPGVEDKSPMRLSAARQLALAVHTDAALPEGLSFLGGERRVVEWQQAGDIWLPNIPDEINKSIRDQKTCRLLLATPAIFASGYKPRWLLEQAVPGLKVEIAGAAVPRYQSISGWVSKWEADNSKPKVSPKPTRRLAPAGSTYFLRLQGTDEQIEQFIKTVWLQNVSDHQHDRNDGFGLALLGAWDGEPRKVDFEHEKTNS